jgi:hypothetical protein
MDVNVLDNPDFDLGVLSLEHANELLGAILRLPQPQQMAAVKKMARKPNPSMEHNSRTKMMRVLHLFPKDIQDGLLNRRLQLVDSYYYVIKTIAGVKNVKMLQDTDNKSAGLGNISKQKLEKDNHFCLTGVILLSGIAVNKEDVVFDVVPHEILNGDFEFKINGGKYITPAARLSCEVFDTSNRTDIRKGLWELHNPKAVEAEQAIEFNIDFAAAPAANTWAKAILVGSSVAPY